MEGPKITVFNSANYDELIAIWEDSVRATHHFLGESDIAFYKPLIMEQYFDQLNLFGIVEAGLITGFMGYQGESIEMLFVGSGCRSKGIGKSLLNYAVENFGLRFVEVNEQNTQAVGFYEHMGFVRISYSAVDAQGKPFPIIGMKLGTREKYIKE